MTDWRDKLKQARLPERTVPVVLRGDLAAEHESVERQLEQAKGRAADSLAGSGVGQLTDRLRAIEAEMVDSVVEFRLRALPKSRRSGDARPSWSELKAGHPPREKDGEILVEDRLAGLVNAKTIAEPLVRESLVYPDDLSEADWADLMGSITERQFDDLVSAAWDLNEGKVDIPFSSADSRTRRTSSAG